jgi:Domain of unknown function (DUF4258)
MAYRRVFYTRHAEDMLVERRIQRAWVEKTVLTPERTEVDPKKSHLRRAYRRIPERGGLWLRVVYDRANDSIRIVTVFFDRGRRS